MSFDYGDDGAPPAPTNDNFKAINALVVEAIKAEEEAEKAEELAKTKRANYNNIIENLLPSEMDRLGLKEFTTAAGTKVKITEDLQHSLSADRKEQGLDWLEQHGHGSVIKRDITISFAKGQEDAAAAVATLIRSNHPDLPVTSTRNVAPMTLKSLLKQLMTDGVIVPEDIFKQRLVKKAKIG